MKIRACMLAAILLAGCASETPAPADARTPQEIISMAAAAAPQRVAATVALQVRAVGNQGGITYLNSERDYRDQRNVSVAIAPEALAKVEARFGGPLASVADGKHIVVKGPARRVTVWFFDESGRRSDKYYFQTQLFVSDPAQIRIL